jgi:cytidine deaminase
MSSIDQVLSSLELPGVTVEERRLLFLAAKIVLPNAYAPYSCFPVAAAVLGQNGQVYTGVNVENASFPLGSCAERQAVGSAVTAGMRDFKAILILTATDRAIPPCGSCRQILREFSDDLPILLTTLGGVARHVSLLEILPDSFGPADLKRTT